MEAGAAEEEGRGRMGTLNCESMLFRLAEISNGKGRDGQTTNVDSHPQPKVSKSIQSKAMVPESRPRARDPQERKDLSNALFPNLPEVFVKS